MERHLPLLMLSALLAMPAGAADYERDIRPLLKSRCVSCHGPVKEKGGLRLDAGKLIHAGGDSGAVITKGHSLLLDLVAHADPEERMPPEGSPLNKHEIALLSAWIEAGAPYPATEAAVDSPQAHWAFQPVRRPGTPQVKDTGWARNPVDPFILAGLEARKLAPAPAAAAETLLRRAYLDLTGLPPTPEEQAAFAANPDLDAVIDDLLSRPAYGERWARHWLDVARYADTNGYERDAIKPFVWRYRDYVIDSLNADKPYDRFLLEQLAGDELPDANAESIIATGFLRLGHWDDEPADPQTDRFDQLDDMLSTTSQAVFALTMGCARCHDHKFEPLSQVDYYALAAIFAPLERPQKGRAELAVPVGTRAELAALRERDLAIAELEKKIASTPEPLRSPFEGMAITMLRQETPDLPLAYTWRETSLPVKPMHLLVRGQASRPGKEVSPMVPEILAGGPVAFPPADAQSTKRRLGLAQWTASADNPLTARVLVNRVWKQHFGEGLVRTPNDFGLMGERPTHPELLDWLADWFTHEGGWSLKRLHRLILTSAAWRQSSRADNPAAMEADPENLLLWRQNYRRLEVEAIRDSVLAVSGALNRRMHGEQMYPQVPAQALEGHSDRLTVWKPYEPESASRRTIYAIVKRSLMVPMMEVLDICDTTQSSPGRRVTTVAPQALTLFNGEFVNLEARHFAERLRREAGTEPAAQVDLAFRLALCRSPREVERAAMTAFLREESLEQMCRVLFNLNEFVYPD